MTADDRDREGETATEDGADDEIEVVGSAATNGQGGVRTGLSDGWELADWTVDAETDADADVDADVDGDGESDAGGDGESDDVPPIPDGFPRTHVNQGVFGEWIDREDRKEWKEWSDFLIEPVSMVETVHGDHRMELVVHPRNGESFSTTVEPTVFNEVRSFRNEICERMTTTWYGSQADLNVLKNGLGRVEIPYKRGTDHMGLHVLWEEGDPCEPLGPKQPAVWVTPDRNLTADGWFDDDETIIEHIPANTVPERALSLAEEYDEEVVCRILELLPRTRDTDRFLPVLGWFYAATLRPYIMNWTDQFNMLFVTGETGAGKTATLETLWELFGMDSSPFSVTDTAFTLDTAMGCTESIPIWYDEFKPSDMSPRQIDMFLDKARKATRGGLSQRGHADQSSDGHRLNAPLVISGEERMHGSAEERRSIFTTFKKASAETGSETARAFAELTGGSAKVNGQTDYYEGYDLSQHATAWYQYATSLNETALHSAWKESGRQVDRILLDADIDPAALEDLVLQGLQTIHFGCHLYRCLLGSLHGPYPITDEEIESAILYVVRDSIGGLNRATHIDTLVDVAARAANEGYLEAGKHYKIVNGDELRLNLGLSLDPIRRYATEYDLPEDLLASRSDYDRRIADVVDDHPYITCRSQNTPPINRAIGIDLTAAKETIADFDGDTFDDYTYTESF